MSEQRTVKLQLRDENGKTKDYFIDFIPQSKKLEYIRKEAELESREETVTNADYDEIQAEFVAGLFNDENVTKQAILDGLDAKDFKQVYDIIRYRVLGFNREEDERLKKLMEENLLAGQNSTTSNSD